MKTRPSAMRVLNLTRARLAEAEIINVVRLVANFGVKSAVAYVSPKMIVKATRARPVDRRGKSQSILLTFGAPNFREREFIRACQKAGEPFPVKKVQLKFFK